MNQSEKQEKPLTLWVVYDSPAEHPGFFIARRFEIYSNDPKPTNDILKHEHLEAIQKTLRAKGLVKNPRNTTDDIKIVETWL
jgi:hypothetical protein